MKKIVLISLLFILQALLLMWLGKMYGERTAQNMFLPRAASQSNTDMYNVLMLRHCLAKKE